MKGTSSCCQAGPLHPLGRRPCLVDRHVQPPRGGTYQCSRVSGHQQRRRAPRGQRARRRRAVGAGSHGGAHVSSAPGAQAAGPRHRPAGWRPTVSSSSTDAGHGTRGASRKPLQPSSSTAPPASHGRRLPTSSAPPGTAPAPAASGRARAPIRCTWRANASTAAPRKPAPGHATYAAWLVANGMTCKRCRYATLRLPTGWPATRTAVPISSPPGSCARAAALLAGAPHRRPLDAPGRPPGAPSARPGARRRRLNGARAARYEARRESPGSRQSEINRNDPL